MDYIQRASMSKKVKNINLLIICAVGSISALGLVMAIYSLINLEFLFAIVYLIAVMLGFSYVIMKINTIMPTYVERNNDIIVVQNWDNGLFPFVTEKGVIGEFIPAKSMLTNVEISSIRKIYIGSKSYLLKVITSGNFVELIKEYKEKYDSILKHMNILYIKTSDDREVFISVTDYDEKDLVAIFKPIVEENEKIDFKCSNRYISKAIPPKKFTF